MSRGKGNPYPFVATRRVYHWRLLPALAVTGMFLVGDLAYFTANMAKIPHGGWFPLLVALLLFVVMTTWIRGRQVLRERTEAGLPTTAHFLKEVQGHPLPRVPGTAVFLSGTERHVPAALLNNIKHNHVLHQQVVFLAVTEDVPRVSRDARHEVATLGGGFHRVVLRYGFKEQANVPGLSLRATETTYFLGKETVLAGRRPGMARWREWLFAVMSRNARNATSFFRLPPNRVVELGSQVEI